MGTHEYSAVTSNLALTVRNLWNFALWAGQPQESDHGAAQDRAGLDGVPTQTYAANSAWQQLVVLAHNLLTNFQLETGAPPRRRTRKHTVVPLLQSVRVTLRFELSSSGRPCWSVPGHQDAVADDRQSPDASKTFSRIANALASG